MNDMEINKNTKMLAIKDVANRLGLDESSLELYGTYKSKIKNHNKTKAGKLVLVTAISPSPYGEGKTTVTIGVSDALNKIGKNSLIAMREPSLGPVFGMKGGANGGGYAQVIPTEDINLHLTGDLDAITGANNLLCAAVDNHILQGNELDIQTVKVHRCLDVNDKALRKIIINGREDYFTITAASEVMAIFCLATSIDNLRTRLGNILVGYTSKNIPVYASELKVEGAMTVLLKNAFDPNLVQTLENNPALVHGGPFANIAHGCNSIKATKMGLDIADYVITEAGFGSDLGAEKFFDIKCRVANIKPNAVILVATTKALKYQSGVAKDDILKENPEAIKQGLKNLENHIKILNNYKVDFIVALNKYDTDNDIEINIIKDFCDNLEVPFEICDSYKLGSQGALNLASKVVELCEKENQFDYLYGLDLDIKNKIRKVCNEIYMSENIVYSDESLEKITILEQTNARNYPICIAKSQYKLNFDPIIIKDIELFNGAEMVTVYTDSIMTMPGLPKKPNYEKIDLDGEGNIVGLS